MKENKLRVEGSGKGGGLTFNYQSFKKNEQMFKTPEISLETTIFSYRQPKDAAEFIK